MMKGDAGSPIWIVVTLLLALVVGITMYQLLRKTSAQKTFGDWLGEIEAGKAQITLENFCTSWYESGFVKSAVDESSLAKATVSAVVLTPVSYFTQEEFDRGERLSPCDCAVYLYQTNNIDSLEAKKWYSPRDCHKLANSVAESRGLTR